MITSENCFASFWRKEHLEGKAFTEGVSGLNPIRGAKTSNSFRYIINTYRKASATEFFHNYQNIKIKKSDVLKKVLKSLTKNAYQNKTRIHIDSNLGNRIPNQNLT